MKNEESFQNLQNLIKRRDREKPIHNQSTLHNYTRRGNSILHTGLTISYRMT